MVERIIRTFRSAYIRYFEAKNTRDWSTEYLSIFVKNYNNRPHTITKEKPSQALRGGAAAFRAFVRIKQHHFKLARKMDPQPSIPPALQPGRYVKIARKRGVFDKEADPRGNFSEEVFKIYRIDRTKNIPVWHLQDLQGERVQGAFYRQELAQFLYSENALFVVERILKQRKRGRRLEYLVSWRGYGPEFNSWVPSTDVSHL